MFAWVDGLGVGLSSVRGVVLVATSANEAVCVCWKESVRSLCVANLDDVQLCAPVPSLGEDGRSEVSQKRRVLALDGEGDCAWFSARLLRRAFHPKRCRAACI